MKTFDAEYIDGLSDKARRNPRGRQHSNIHDSYEDACQREFNAIEPGSYIRAHRHASDPLDELLIAVRGALALVTFDDQGTVACILRLEPRNTVLTLL